LVRKKAKVHLSITSTAKHCLFVRVRHLHHKVFCANSQTKRDSTKLEPGEIYTWKLKSRVAGRSAGKGTRVRG
jgi:hypothetical protein